MDGEAGSWDPPSKMQRPIPQPYLPTSSIPLFSIPSLTRKHDPISFHASQVKEQGRHASLVPGLVVGERTSFPFLSPVG